MNYKYYENENYEDYASGRVIYHKTNMPNFPVRLAGEIFKRCLEYTSKKENITLYDPCCGGGYLLTVLGLLNRKTIKEIIASDINEDAVALVSNNLSLLSKQGLLKRKNQIEEMIEKMGKTSHREALNSVNRFINEVELINSPIETSCFVRDILQKNTLNNETFKADIVIVDVPYGNLVEWSDHVDAVNLMLQNIIPIITKDSVIAVITDKSQKVNVLNFHRQEKFKIGKRVINILKYGE